MSARDGLAPTRMNLLRVAQRLERLSRGAAVLRRKREALVAELFRLARPAADARSRIAERTRRAYPALLEALAVHGRFGLRAIGWPARALAVELEAGSVWGVAVASMVRPPPPRARRTRSRPWRRRSSKRRHRRCDPAARRGPRPHVAAGEHPRATPRPRPPATASRNPAGA